MKITDLKGDYNYKQIKDNGYFISFREGKPTKDRSFSNNSLIKKSYLTIDYDGWDVVFELVEYIEDRHLKDVVFIYYEGELLNEQLDFYSNLLEACKSCLYYFNTQF
jgi:hypothetical protein